MTNEDACTGRLNVVRMLLKIVATDGASGLYFMLYSCIVCLVFYVLDIYISLALVFYILDETTGRQFSNECL